MTTSEITETQRDLNADLAICNAANEAYMIHASAVVGENGPYLNVEVYTEDGRPLTSDDATFIIEARTGWPHAIKRAIAAEEVAEMWRNEAATQAQQYLDAQETIALLRAGIAAAMAYPPGIIRAKLSRILAEVGAGE